MKSNPGLLILCCWLMLAPAGMATEEPLLSHTFSIYYQNSLLDLEQGGTQIQGPRSHQLRARGLIRLEPDWLVTAALMGDRAEIEVSNFISNPVTTTDSFLGEVSVNKIWWETPRWGLASGLSYLYYKFTPDNLDQDGVPIPFTNTIMDYQHLLQGPGLYGTGVYQFNENLSLAANLGLYPYLFANVNKGPELGYTGLGRGQIELRYRLLDGFLVSALVNQEFWLGSFYQSQTSFGLGLSLVPGQIKETY